MSGRGAERILLLIEWMAEQPSTAAFMDAVKQLDLPKSSALALFRLLIEKGYIKREEDGRYTLLRVPGEPSPTHHAWGVLLRQARPHLQRAVETLGESGFIAVLEEDLNVRYLGKILPTREIRYDRDITIPRRPHRVSAGVVLLSGFSDSELVAYAGSESAAGRLAESVEALIEQVRTTRQMGVQVNLRGVVEGAAGVSAPIVDGDDHVIAALNIAGPANRLVTDLEQVKAIVREAAVAVSRAMATAPTTFAKLYEKEQTE